MPRPDVSDERKTQIVNAAITIFRSKGYHHATMPEIAKQAGLSIGGVYWYFKSKDQIVAQILNQLFDPDIAMLNNLLQGGTAAGDRLRQLALLIADSFEQQQWLMPIGTEFYGSAMHDPHARTVIQTYLQRYRHLLTSLIKQGIATGEFHPVDPTDTANALLALEEGLSLLVSVDPEQIRWKPSITLAIDLFIQGLRRNP